jgi:hypothetical protein
MTQLTVPPVKFIQFVRDNPNLKVMAMPEKYVRTDTPFLLVSHELFSKMLQELGYIDEASND